MELALIVAFLFLVAFVFAFGQFSVLKKRIEELKTKLRSSTESQPPRVVQFDRNENLSEIGNYFNQLIEAYNTVLETNRNLEKRAGEVELYREKLRDLETNASQISLLTEVGQRITGSLELEQVLVTIFNYVQSSMSTSEMNLVYTERGALQAYSIAQGNSINDISAKAETELVKWVFGNGKPAIIQNADKDYHQFVQRPIVTSNGAKAQSVVAVPLISQQKVNGVLVIFGANENAFQQHHLDFIFSLASYLEVALDNAKVYALLDEEKDKSEKLLLNILPQTVAEELKTHGKAQAREFKNASILFTDFKGFTAASSTMTPTELVEELNAIFKGFDEICARNGVEKIKTIGDAYMAAVGVSDGGNENDDAAKNAEILANTALEMILFLKLRKLKNEQNGKLGFEMRAGIHSGPVVAGVVGLNKFQFDIWGDSVNTASRMESNGLVGELNISSTTQELLKNTDFGFEKREEIQVKGKGNMTMYLVKQPNSKRTKAAVDYILNRLQNELPDSLHYHSAQHTKQVIENALHIGQNEKISDAEMELLHIGAAYHDAGFMIKTQNHEALSCQIADATLPSFGFNENELAEIKKMIMATKIPQTPTTHLGQILCDSDLAYFGGDQYFEISGRLISELRANGLSITDAEWHSQQISFLQNHQFWTLFAKQAYSEKKDYWLNELMNI
ncbi:MAG: GAF domain-containing protein [Bacteroidetes bacterium]|nr:GAF domain-containing protein [Bacteroidota bacterium]